MEARAKRPRQSNGCDDAMSTPMADAGGADEARKCQSMAKCRLFVGNLTPEVNKEELEQLFAKYGRIAEFFYSEKGFAFVRYEDRSSAETAKSKLDDFFYCGRALRIRFAANNNSLLIKELSPFVSNELLYESFSGMGDVVRAVHIVDDHGRPAGMGIVEFSRKQVANEVLKRINEGVMVLCDNGRPIAAEMHELKDDEDGLPERVIVKNVVYVRQRQVPPHFARPGSFEFECGSRWKKLYETEKEKRDELERQFKEERAKLEAEMEVARQRFEARMLREAEMQRQQEMEESHRQRMEMMNSVMMVPREPSYPMQPVGPPMGAYPRGPEFHPYGWPVMPGPYGTMHNEPMMMPRNLPMARFDGMRNAVDLYRSPMPPPRYGSNSPAFSGGPFRPGQLSCDMRSAHPSSVLYNGPPAGYLRHPQP